MQIWCDGVKRCHPELVSGFSGYFIDTLSLEKNNDYTVSFVCKIKHNEINIFKET